MDDNLIAMLSQLILMWKGAWVRIQTPSSEGVRFILIPLVNLIPL